MSTSNLNVRYFVKSDFREQYPKGSDARRRVEDNVEQEYLDALRTNCYQEHVNSKGCVVVCGRILNYLLLESQRKGMFGCSFLQNLNQQLRNNSSAYDKCLPKFMAD